MTTTYHYGLGFADGRFFDARWGKLGRVLAQSIAKSLVAGLEVRDSQFKSLYIARSRTGQRRERVPG